MPQNLFNGTSETVPVEGSVVGRHQQLSQLLQTKSSVPAQSHAGIPTSQRIPSPSVASITSVKSPHANNLNPPNATVNKTITPVSSSAINVSDGNIAVSNISNTTVNSLSNTSGLGMNNNMLLMQSKSGALGSQGNLVSLSTSVSGNNNTGSLHPPPVAVVSNQLTQQQNAGSLINGNLLSIANANSLNINRGVNPNALAPSPHQNILGHPLPSQGANLKVCIILYKVN